MALQKSDTKGELVWKAKDFCHLTGGKHGLEVGHRWCLPPEDCQPLIDVLCHQQNPLHSAPASLWAPRPSPESRPESPDCTAHLWEGGQSSELVKHHLNQTNALGDTAGWPEGLGLFLHSSVLTELGISQMPWAGCLKHNTLPQCLKKSPGSHGDHMVTEAEH